MIQYISSLALWCLKIFKSNLQQCCSHSMAEDWSCLQFRKKFYSNPHTYVLTQSTLYSKQSPPHNMHAAILAIYQVRISCECDKTSILSIM